MSDEKIPRKEDPRITKINNQRAALKLLRHENERLQSKIAYLEAKIRKIGGQKLGLELVEGN